VEYDGWQDVNVCTLYGMMKQIEKTLFVSFIFPFFINLRNVGGVMHMHTLWIIDDVWHAMIFFLNQDDDACMNTWMHGWDSWDSNLLLFFIFPFFINLRNVEGVMHMHTLWIIDDVWHAMIFFLNLDDDACMDVCMHGWNLLYSKRWITHACMTWYDVWIFLLHFFLKKKFEFIPISLLFLIHGIILLWFFFLLFQMISLI